MDDIENNYNTIKQYGPELAPIWSDRLKGMSIEELTIKHNLEKREVLFRLELADDILKYHPQYLIINKYDNRAAIVWLERMLWRTTHVSMSEIMNVSPSESRQLYKRAKYILEHQNEMWTNGLSNRAKFALLKQGYKSLKQLIHDIEVDGVDICTIEGIGENVSGEITRWLNKQKPLRQ